MTNTVTETHALVVEREIPYPPEKIWRALKARSWSDILGCKYFRFPY